MAVVQYHYTAIVQGLSNELHSMCWLWNICIFTD